MKPTLYDEKSLNAQTLLQRAKAWDLEDSIPWSTPIDLNKPLVPLDERALLFPGASAEERLIISQFFGLMVAASISEMEEILIRLRREVWTEVHEAFPVSPEFIHLGDLFFEEELKHSQAFERYIFKFSEALGIDVFTLRDILPHIQGTTTEYLLKRNIEKKGQCFWWIVASVEQEFLSIYKALEPFENELEPLYFDIHKKHFEEEARHASFPYLVLELLTTRNPSMGNWVHSKMDLAFSQILKAAWTVQSLKKIKLIKDLQHTHPFFHVIHSALPLLENQSAIAILWQLMTRTPYVSSLIHPRSHQKILRAAEKAGAVVLPFPKKRSGNKVA